MEKIHDDHYVIEMVSATSEWAKHSKVSRKFHMIEGTNCFI